MAKGKVLKNHEKMCGVFNHPHPRLPKKRSVGFFTPFSPYSHASLHLPTLADASNHAHYSPRTTYTRTPQHQHHHSTPPKHHNQAHAHLPTTPCTPSTLTHNLPTHNLPTPLHPTARRATHPHTTLQRNNHTNPMD